MLLENGLSRPNANSCRLMSLASLTMASDFGSRNPTSIVSATLLQCLNSGWSAMIDTWRVMGRSGGACDDINRASRLRVREQRVIPWIKWKTIFSHCFTPTSRQDPNDILHPPYVVWCSFSRGKRIWDSIVTQRWSWWCKRQFPQLRAYMLAVG